MNRKIVAIFLAVFTTFIWAGSYIVNKIAFSEGISPMTLSGIRYLFAGLFLFLVLRKPGEGKRMPLKYVILQAVLSYVIGQGMQSIGQKILVPTVSSLIVNSGMIIFIMIADYIFLKEVPGKSAIIKVLIMVLGMLLYYQPWSDISEPINTTGIIVIIIAAFGLSANTFLNRYMIKNKGIEHVSLTIYPMITGGIIMLIVGIATSGVPSFSWKLFFCLMYLTFAGSALATTLWVWSQQILSAPQSAAINSAVIIEIAFLDLLVFGRQLNHLNWLGIICVFFGIIWLQITKNK